VSEVVDAVFAALDRGDLQVYVPAWFGDLPAQKARDVQAFLTATADYVRQHRPDDT
jgi:hypothetical protein